MNVALPKTKTTRPARTPDAIVNYLHVISSLDPQGGGPAEGVRQLSAAARRLHHKVEIATLDPPAAPWDEDFECPVHQLGPASLGRYRYGPKLLGWLHENAGRFDAVIVNGLWQYHGFATWRRSVNYNTWLVENGFMALKGANEKLMELLTALSGDSTEAIAQLARVTNIGAEDGTKKTPGGLIISVGAVVPDDFEHVVFVRCKANNRKVAARTTTSLAQMVKSFASGEPAPSGE